MRRLPPISLRVRIGLIVAIHALLLLATLHVFLCGVPGASTRMYILPPADRVAAIVRAFDAAPPSAWPALVRAFGDDRQALRLLSDLSSREELRSVVLTAIMFLSSQTMRRMDRQIPKALLAFPEQYVEAAE